MNDRRLDSIEQRLKQLEAGGKNGKTPDAFLAQFYTAEYSVIMARVSAWTTFQYAAWPILIGALALIVQVKDVPVNFRWWAAVGTTLVVYLAYQSLMLVSLYYVLLIEGYLRPLASSLANTDHFWIHERVYRRNFPANPAWSPNWPPIISFAVIVAVTGGLMFYYGFHWVDLACAVLTSGLGMMVVFLTRQGKKFENKIAFSARR
jgi:hypothetical protein